MAWQPGESGNPEGRPEGRKPFLATLKRALAADDGEKLRKVAEKLVSEAVKGEPWAVQMLADRLDGKPAQAIMNEDGTSLFTGITITVVHSALPSQQRLLNEPGTAGSE